MKDSAPEDYHPAASQVRGIRKGVVVCAFFTLLAFQVFGQAPPLLWSTNVGATLFAVDANTNLYASVGGTVIKLDRDGVTLQTNAYCPLPGIARRDSASNFYFAGKFSGTQDFGGIVLGVQFNSSSFIAKYSSVGVLLWVTNFGPNNIDSSLQIRDLEVDADGNAYVGHTFKLPGPGSGSSYLARFNASGSNVWDILLSSTSIPGEVKVWPSSATNCFVLRYYYTGSHHRSQLLRIDSGGNATSLYLSGDLSSNFIVQDGKPCINSQGSVYAVDVGTGFLDLMQINGQTAVVGWRTQAGTNALWALATDWLGGVYVGQQDFVPSALNRMSRYDSEGRHLWTLTSATRCTAAISDAYGNLFASFADGTITRFAAEPAEAPIITNSPAGGTVFSGTTALLSVGVAGSAPFHYTWRLNGANLSTSNNATLILNYVAASQGGMYSVVVTNISGAQTSSAVLLRVKEVALYAGSQLLTNGTYSFLTPPTISINTAYPNGSKFYTLDGSTPTFASTSYTTPFTVSTSTTVRAIGYSADFLQSEEADQVNIVLPPSFSLTATSTPGGFVTANPAGGIYPSNTVVTLTATPTNGWSFLYWQGDVTATSPSIAVTMNAAKSVQAVFGTILGTTVSGNGQIAVHPPGGTYPYGSVVRLTAVPQAGNYFGVWGNAASGNANPLYFKLTNPNPTVSSLFAPLAANQAALTVLVNGPGSVQVNPAGNVFTTNQSVSITAAPLAGQGFVNWSGDAAGTQNPVSVDMTQSRVVTANFTNWPVLVANQQSFTPQGFQLSVLSGPGLVYQIQASSNLGTWTNLGVVTNTSGNTLFIDPAGMKLPMRFYRGTSWP